ncbi:single-stranded DNA-binding protein, partial [Limosilactobacillus reuteri]|uniref:single-stranded DNA-binding protein n=1 Tax=Limosilactobacillus reuteri TaxID=1598 RepID=UPI00081BDED7
MNDIKLLGRLTQAPELKERVNGNQYAWFTVAVPRKSNCDEADFIRCKAFGKLAGALKQHCDKGCHFLLSGRLEFSSSFDQQTQFFF